MIRIKIKKCNNSIAEMVCEGHSGYDENGKDIVCASISSITQTALLGILHVAEVKVKYTMNDDNGYLRVVIPTDLSVEQRHDCDVILNTMLLGLSDIYQGFSEFIELEVK